MKNLPLIALTFLPLASEGQSIRDTLFVAQQPSGGWYAQYRVAGERTVFDLNKTFGIPAATLADANGLSYTARLQPGQVVRVPLSPYNWYSYMPPPATMMHPLHYRATREWNEADLAAEVRTSKRALREWNGGRTGDVRVGEVVAVGWISLGIAGLNDAGPRGMEATSPPPPPGYPRDTVLAISEDTVAAVVPVISPIEQMFLDQTAGGTMVTTEKGPAAFFPGSGGSSKGVHYAFHNAASRGSVVRVFNPGTGRTVYAKVLGPMPGTKVYAGAVIGISAAAKAALGVRGDARMWCEVSYAGY